MRDRLIRAVFDTQKHRARGGGHLLADAIHTGHDPLAIVRDVRRLAEADSPGTARRRSIAPIG